MALVILKTAEEKKRYRIYNMLRSTDSTPNATVSQCDDCKIITIKHIREYVPDFHLVWCPIKQHYRVYILVASTDKCKHNAGYNIFNIGGYVAACTFVMFYSFIYKNRGNNKEALSV